MKVKVIKNESVELPKYETTASAGCDVRANIETAITLNPGTRALIKTGIKAQIPDGYEIQVRPRSGLAYKHGITVLNTPGTIDADFTGEIGVILLNTSTEPFTINNGDRIAQLVMNKFEQISWEEVEVLDSTERGENGFGSTGKN